MALGGIRAIVDDPEHSGRDQPDLRSIVSSIMGMSGLLALGAVFLAVTGAEALYADLGHFGRRPIQIAWLGLVLPSLALNYVGQRASTGRPEQARKPVFPLIRTGRCCPWWAWRPSRPSRAGP